MRSLLTALALTLVIQAQAQERVPLTTLSKTPVGVSDKAQCFVAINESTRGRRTNYRPIAYSASKWKRMRQFRAPKYQVVAPEEKLAETPADPKPLTKAQAKAQARAQARAKARAKEVAQSVDAELSKWSVYEAETIPGGFTGRWRIRGLGATIYREGDQLLARTGDASVMKKMVMHKRLSSLLPVRCRGKQESKLLSVVARVDWKAAAVYVEVSCVPDNEKKAPYRVRKLIVRSLKEVL